MMTMPLLAKLASSPGLSAVAVTGLLVGSVMLSVATLPSEGTPPVPATTM